MILIIVSSIVTTIEFEAGGGGAGAPVDGISPAIADAESTQVSTEANRKRFILVFPSESDARTLAIILEVFAG